MRYIIAMTGIAVFLTAVAFSDEIDKKNYLYQWTDDKGVMHMTDTLNNVPEAYRKKARKMETGKGGEGTGGQQLQRENSPVDAESSEEAEDAEEAGKAEWQQQIKTWKSKLARAENHYQELDQQWKTLYGRWGGAAYSPPETKLQVQQIQQEMETTKQEIDEARNMIDVVIPERARKAGVPPGWLRE